MKISCAFLICLLFVVAVVSSSAVPLKLEDKSDVTDHDQKADDCITPSDLRKHFKRLLIEAADEVVQDARKTLNGAFSGKDFPDADKKYKKSHE